MSETGSAPENALTMPTPTNKQTKNKPKKTYTTVSGALTGLGGSAQEGAGAEAALPTDTRVLTTEDPEGTVHIDQQIGTTKSAANKYFICRTRFDDIQETGEKWILGKITTRTTKHCIHN